MNPRSIGFRLTIWYAAALTLGFALLGSLTWLSLRHQLLAEMDSGLAARARQFSAYFQAESNESTVTLKDELSEFCQALPPAHSIDVRGSRGFAFRCGASTAGQPRVLRQTFEVGSERYDLTLAAPLEATGHTLDLLRALLFGLSPVVILIACLGGAWISHRALRPVKSIAAAAMTVSIENLSERLPVPKTADELAVLSRVLNRMLDRLESAVKTLSQFAADASHELRTPLAVIQTTAELALRRTRTPESYRESLQQITEETQRMSGLIASLLDLERKDAGSVQLPLTPTDLGAIVSQVCAELHGLAAERAIQFEMHLGEKAAVVSGNPPALRRLFLALAENALKYSPAGATVEIAVEQSDAQITVAFKDDGQGIHESDLPHIFDRFYRADRSRSTAGYGLGLSLAKSLALAHNAAIEVRSSPGAGSVFQVTFPLPSKQASGNLQLASV